MNIIHGWKKFLLGTDPHGDMQDEAANRVFFQFADDFKPDLRVCGGDVWDFRPLRKGANEEEKKESVKKDFEAGRDWIKKFKPNFLLRGNHCLHKDSELLTVDGWKPITKITKSDYVAQFDSDRKISYAHPLRLVESASEDLYAITGALTKQLVTGGRDVVVDGKKVKAESLLGKKIKASSIFKSGFHQTAASPMDADWIRLLTWVVMDGTIVIGEGKSKKGNKARVQFKLSHKHKIERLCALLNRIGISHSVKESKKTGCNVLQPYVIRFYGDNARLVISKLGGVKKIPEYWHVLPKENLVHFIEELAVTDGYTKDASISWVTTEYDNANIISLWCIKNGVDFSITKSNPNASGFANAKQQWRCALKYREIKNDSQNLTIERIHYFDMAYCVTMPLGTIISRYEGHVAFTGNCERLWELAKADKGLASDYAQEGVEEIESLLKKIGCRSLPYHKRHGVLKIGSLKILHGFYCGVNAARQHALVYGACLFGHVHTVDEHAIAGLERRVARSVGCLCKLDHDYNSRTPSSLRHAHGFAYGIVSERTGKYFIQQAECIEGKWMIPTDFKEYK